MAVDTQHSTDWAHNTFVALNDMHASPSADKWQPFASSDANVFSIPPSLLTQASIERFGQITPPEELSPADVRRDSGYRESSIPIEQLHNEVSWPMQQGFDSLKQFNHSVAQDEVAAPTAPVKRRRVSREQGAANHTSPAPHSSQQSPTDNPTPPKRKRGRPKAQPQMVEAYTRDGLPFQVTSARQNHLEKNRVAAHKCRQRKKTYIEGLEGRAREFSGKNKILKENVAQLREEVLELKNEVLRHAGCGFWAVDEYLARCAGDLLGMGPGNTHLSMRKPSQTQSPTLSSLEASKKDRESTTDSLPSMNMDMDMDDEDYGGLELLKGFDDDKEDGDD